MPPEGQSCYHAPVARTARIAFAAFASLTIFPLSANASGYLSARFGSDQGHPAIPNAYAVYFNPAALGGATGTELTLDATLAYRTASYQRNPNALSPSVESQKSSQAYVDANTGKATLSNVLASPFFGAFTDLGTRSFRLGFASYIPFGGQASWSKTDAADPVVADGPQRWHVIDGRIVAWYNTLAASYTYAPARLSIGVSVSAVKHDLETVRARNSNGSDDVTTSDGSLVEGRSYVTASGVNVAAAIGVHWEPLDDHRLRLGASYSIRPGFGEMRLRGTLKQQFGGVAAPAPETPIDFLQQYPDVLRVGGTYRPIRQLEVRSDLEYVRWSSFTRQCVVAVGEACDVAEDGSGPPTVILNVPRKWQDAVGVRAGVGYWLNDDLEVFASVGLSTSAVSRANVDASTIDGTRYRWALGARWEASKRLVFGASLNQSYMPAVATGGAVGVQTYRPPSRSPSSDGRYTQNILYANANATVRF